MIKSAPQMIDKLKVGATYGKLKAWASAVEDWLYSHTQVYPDRLGPSAVRSVARMTLSAELYSLLEGDGVLGRRAGTAAGDTATWNQLMDHIRDRLGCSKHNLKVGLALLRQNVHSTKDFAREFERRAKDAEMGDEDAKVMLITALN